MGTTTATGSLTLATDHTAIIVALIGMVGVVLAALITGYFTLRTRKDVTGKKKPAVSAPNTTSHGAQSPAITGNNAHITYTNTTDTKK